MRRPIQVDTALDTLRRGRPDRAPDYDRVVDPMTGLVLWTREFSADPDMPVGMHSVTARGCDARLIGDWPADPVGGGDGTDAEECRRAAIGEYLERYCGNYVRRELVRGSWSSLVDDGRRVLDPDSLALFSSSQYAAAGFPFEPFTRDLEVNWAQGVSLVSGEPTLVPASLVWVNYIYGRYLNEPATNFHQFSGLAAGDSLWSAVRSGLSELLERDATMMWWHGDYSAPLLSTADDATVTALTTPTRPEISWHLTALPSDFGVPVIGALLIDERDGIAGMGFGCRSTAGPAAVKAVAEAVQLRALSLGIKDPNGKVWRSIDKGIVHGNTLRPYRADLTYRDAFRPDFRDLTDLAHHSQIYLDRRMWPALNRITESPLRATMNELPEVEGDFVTTMVDRLAERGLDVLCVDVTTRDVAEAGFWVVRVIVPGLLPNGPAGFPFLGGSRLHDVPVARGWRATRLTPDEVNHDPLPHS